MDTLEKDAILLGLQAQAYIAAMYARAPIGKPKLVRRYSTPCVGTYIASDGKSALEVSRIGKPTRKLTPESECLLLTTSTSKLPGEILYPDRAELVYASMHRQAVEWRIGEQFYRQQDADLYLWSIEVSQAKSLGEPKPAMPSGIRIGSPIQVKGLITKPKPRYKDGSEAKAKEQVKDSNNKAKEASLALAGGLWS